MVGGLLATRSTGASFGWLIKRRFSALDGLGSQITSIGQQTLAAGLSQLLPSFQARTTRVDAESLNLLRRFGNRQGNGRVEPGCLDLATEARQEPTNRRTY